MSIIFIRNEFEANYAEIVFENSGYQHMIILNKHTLCQTSGYLQNWREMLEKIVKREFIDPKDLLDNSRYIIFRINRCSVIAIGKCRREIILDSYTLPDSMYDIVLMWFYWIMHLAEN